MTIAICVVILIAVIAATWFVGLWNNVITLINVVFAASIASVFYEPVADAIEARNPTYTYMVDFVCLWGLFFVSFVVLRGVTDLLSRNRLEFDVWVEMIGRTVLSIAISWIFLCFTLFTLHTAPLPLDSDFQTHPDTVNFLGGPDRLWLAFLQSRSQGALAESIDGPLLSEYDLNSLHADDQNLEVRVFDSRSDFIYKYHHRRQLLAGEEALRVFRP